MSPELDAQLAQKYPKIFVHPQTGESTAQVGGTACCTSCPDGWFPILNVLCETLQVRTDRCGSPQVIARDIKEKRGQPCFIFEGGDDYQDGLIDMAEQAAALIPME